MDKINQAKKIIMLKDKLLSYLLSRFEIIITKNFGKTAATNGLVIYFNPDFLNSLKVDEVVFILLHELLHITLDHLKRIGDRDREIFNIAADIVVNDLLVFSGYSYGELPIILGRNFETNGLNNTVEEIYDSLDKSSVKCRVINHNYWTDTNRDYANKIINEAIKKGYSNETSYLNRYIKSLIESKTNWKSLLNEILKSNENDYSFQKTDKRYEDLLLPDFTNQEESLDNVWLLVDVSGSMNDHELVKGFGEINKIISSYDSVNLIISAFSTFVTYPKKVRSSSDLKKMTKGLESGGGTNFQIIFDYMLKLEKLPIAIIIITDGYAQFPDKSKTKNIPVFWAINNNSVKAPFGYNIKI
jgi:predicted metal-dependent peptidase